MFRDRFIQAIHDKKKLKIEFYSAEDGHAITRICAPMDIGPGRKHVQDRSDRYWVWDYESDGPKGPHSLPIKPEHIRSMEPTGDLFDPQEFIRTFSSAPSWFIPRDW